MANCSDSTAFNEALDQSVRALKARSGYLTCLSNAARKLFRFVTGGATDVDTETVTDSRFIYLTCPNCGCDKPKVWVHGHYQCADCKCVADGDCCQGETSGGETHG